jgi:hypothetical protein
MLLAQPVIPICPICRVFGKVCCKLHRDRPAAAATVRGEGHPAITDADARVALAIRHLVDTRIAYAGAIDHTERQQLEDVSIAAETNLREALLALLGKQVRS